MPTVLVVDDEVPLRELIRAYLEREGYVVHEADNGRDALSVLARVQPDVVVLDLMLPEIDGIEVCRRVRATSDVYIIMLTARADEVDRVVGLEVGADDYLTKPFSPRELVARVRAVLRRARTPNSSNKVLKYDDLTIDVEGHEIRMAGEEVAVTSTEFRLIVLLATTPGRLYTRTQLLEQVWGVSYYGDDHVVDVHIANARRKLKEDPASPRFIETVRGAGYRWRQS
ncbi:MAG: response regulator [Roseiflexaceae bacterium]|jgi:two-component system alkaline phosphatase synthesis response regulator PhoP|nr:response regulator transcription factor [Chloroflexaceae bacterium]